MNISRRSLVFSFIFHASLVLTGTVWFLLSPGGSGGSVRAESRRKVQLTPVVLASPTPAPTPAHTPTARPPVKTLPRTPSPRLEQSQTVSSAPSPEPVRAQPVRVKTPSLSELAKPYPTATKAPLAPAAAGERKPSRRAVGRARSQPAPLWTPDQTPTPSGLGETAPTPDLSQTPRPTGATSGGDEPPSGETVSEPTPIGVIDPGADVESFKQLASGYVEVEFEILADGEVAAVTLLQGTGIAAVDTDLVVYFKKFRWNPKLVGGVAVDSRQSMDFQLEARRN